MVRQGFGPILFLPRATLCGYHRIALHWTGLFGPFRAIKIKNLEALKLGIQL